MEKQVNQSALRSRIIVGSLVRHDANHPVMTVEAMRYSAFGAMARCVYFDGTNTLKERQISVRSLSKIDEVAEIKTIAPGQKVMIKSGGPAMSVQAINMSANRCISVWENTKGRFVRRTFPISALLIQDGGLKQRWTPRLVNNKITKA